MGVLYYYIGFFVLFVCLLLFISFQDPPVALHSQSRSYTVSVCVCVCVYVCVCCLVIDFNKLQHRSVMSNEFPNVSHILLSVFVFRFFFVGGGGGGLFSFLIYLLIFLCTKGPF